MTDHELYQIKPVKSAMDIPSENHWAVLVQKIDRFDIPGDERSRTNPGHGYPATTEFVHQLEYYPFTTTEEVNQYIECLVTKKGNPVPTANIRVIFVTSTAQVCVTTKVSVNIY